MAFVRIFISSCIALATLSLTSGFEGLPSFNASEVELPKLGDTGSALPFGIPHFSFPFFGGFGRSKRQAEAIADGNNETEHEGRLFFGSYPSLTGCNSTAQRGRTCLTCRQALTCFSNNLGLLTTCRGVTRYCSDGRCTYIQPANCTS